jgi:DNA polymerase-3 subunit delta'
MKTKEYLINKQHIVYQVLKNSFKNKKTSHAYIISGSKGSPILDTAIFLAQSLVCLNKDENNLACEECINCQKIKNNAYVDYKLIEGVDLKNDVTLAIQDDFNKSSVENEDIKIYIINLIEKAPVASLNKLLKFIEEPNSNIVAIFTSNSVDSILQTIVSRCQTITLKEFMVSDLIDYLVNNNVSYEDAWLISKISNNAEKNLDLVNDVTFNVVKNQLANSLKHLGNKNDYFIVDFLVEGMKNLTENSSIELFLDMLEVCLLEAIIKQEDKEHKSVIFDEQISKISEKYQHIDHMIDDITKAKIDLLSNANKNLVFDKLLINLLRR